MQVTPYLNYRGQCREAFTHYADVLGGEIEMMMTHGDSPMRDQVKEEMREAIMHASLKLPGGQYLLGSDAPFERMEGVQGFYVSLTLDTPAEAERTWAALSEGGDVEMPLQETFFSPRFGMVRDRFGTPWMLNTAAPR
jgi:PhnB protein